MLSLPEGSPRTRSLWGGQQRHAIRLETAVLALCSLSVILAAVDMATAVEWSLGIWVFPIPVLSLGLSASAIFFSARRTLHPTYSVSVATTLFCIWILTAAVATWSDQWRMWRPSEPPGLLMVKDILYGVTTLTYLIYVGVAAKAVENYRKRKRRGILELDDGMGTELMKKKEQDHPQLTRTDSAL